MRVEIFSKEPCPSSIADSAASFGKKTEPDSITSQLPFAESHCGGAAAVMLIGCDGAISPKTVFRRTSNAGSIPNVRCSASFTPEREVDFAVNPIFA